MTAPTPHRPAILSRLTHPNLDRVWVIGIGLIVAAPLLSGDLPYGFDAANHILRIELLVESLRAGLLYPRWMPDLHLGFGAPLLTFYAPAVYYAAAGFGLLGMAAEHALRWTTILLLVLSGLGVWQLTDSVYASAERGRRWAALIAAAAYSASPYLVFNAYTRTATPELMAQVLVPWALWAVRGLLLEADPNRYRLPLALSLAAVVASHTVSIVITPVFIGVAALGYAALMAGRSQHRWQLAARQRVPALMGAGLLALALSAWLWLPLVLERRDLGTEQYLEARRGEPYESVPVSETFTTTWLFPHNSTVLLVPISLGLVALASVGIWLSLRQRRWEALLYVSMAALALVGHWQIAQPLLEASGATRLIQFPWRLQTWVYLPLAVLAGGVASAVRPPWPRRLAAVTVITFLIVSGAPLGLKRIIFREPLPLNPEARVAHVEGGAAFTSFGLTADQEFLPAWVHAWPESMLLPNAVGLPATTDVEVAVLAAAPLERLIEIRASQPFTLTLTDYYFPGWQSTINGRPAALRPTAGSGLLALPVPRGTSQVRLLWAPTRVHEVALVLTVVGFIVAWWLAWRQRRTSPAQLVLASAWIAPIMLLSWPRPAPANVVAPDATVVIGAGQPAQLLAVRAQPRPKGVLLEAHWWVPAPLDDLALVWRLRRPDGSIAQTINGRPYFDRLYTTAWPAPGLIDDRVFIPWPDDQAATRYTLTLCAQPASVRQPVCSDDQPITELDAPLTGPAPIGDTALFGPACNPCLEPVSGRVGDLAELVGVGFLNWQRPLPLTPHQTVIVTPQDGVEVVLAWRGLGWLDDRYHSTVFMLTPAGQQVSYSDHVWTTTFSTVRQWAPGTYRLDYHTMYPRLDTPSGVYALRVGVFDLETSGFVPWTSDQGELLGDFAVVRTIKWLNPPTERPRTVLDTPLSDFARISGVTVSGTRARAGETVSVSVFARANGPASRDLTRFIHLYNELGGLIAQADGTPGGANPTSSWQPGEMVVDPIQLTIAADARPGVYRLLLGYYDPLTGERAGLGTPDNVLLLAEIEVD